MHVFMFFPQFLVTEAVLMIQEVEHQTSTKCESSHSFTDFILIWQQPEWSLWGLMSWDDNYILYWAVSIHLPNDRQLRTLWICSIDRQWKTPSMCFSNKSIQKLLTCQQVILALLLRKLHTSSSDNPNVLSLFCTSIFSLRLSVFLSSI